MKILTRYVLKEHVGPLLFALATLTSLLLLDQIAKQFGQLVGKGLGWAIIGEFFVLTLPLVVALTIPMAVLVSVLYAFSRLASENEVTALKASGIGLVRIITPVLWGGFAMSLIMLAFNDQVLPRTNHRLRTLETDIGKKKPTFALREQVINEVSPGKLYLKTGHIDERSNRLEEVTIYDMGDPIRRRTVYADSGTMELSADQRDLEMTLFNGYSEESPKDKPGEMQRVYFLHDNVRVKGVSNKFETTQNDDYKSEREMSVCGMTAVFEQGERVLGQARIALTEAMLAATRSAALGTAPTQPVTALPKAPLGLGRAYCRYVLEPLHVPGTRVAAPAPAPSPVASKVPASGSAARQQPSPQTVATTPTQQPAQQPAQQPETNPSARHGAQQPTTRPPVEMPGKQPFFAQPGAQQRSAQQAPAPSPATQTAQVTTDSVAQARARASVEAAARMRPPAPPVAPPATTTKPITLVAKPAVAEHAQTGYAPSSGALPDAVGAAATAAVQLGAPGDKTVTAAIGQFETIKSRITDARQTVARYDAQIQKMFALAAACVVLVLLGAPIALRFPRGGVGLVIGVSLFVFSIYYIGLIAGETLAENLFLKPVVAMWLTNIVFTAVGLFFLQRVAKSGATARGGDMSELWESMRAAFVRQALRLHLISERRRAPADATQPTPGAL